MVLNALGNNDVEEVTENVASGDEDVIVYMCEVSQ